MRVQRMFRGRESMWYVCRHSDAASELDERGGAHQAERRRYDLHFQRVGSRICPGGPVSAGRIQDRRSILSADRSRTGSALYCPRSGNGGPADICRLQKE